MCWYPHENWKLEHIFYTKNQSTKCKKDNICQSSMWLSPPQRWHISHQTNNWWWQAFFPPRLRFSCCNPIEGENSLQRRHFNPWFPIYLRRHQNYFLCAPMEFFGFTKITSRWIPEEICTQYNLYYILKPDGYVYCEVRKRINGLNQAARLAFDNTVKLLAPHSYFPVCKSPSLWKHHTWPTVFTLCFDNFGIKANSVEDAHHLTNVIKKIFKWSIDWEDQNYFGLTLDWNFAKNYVDISMTRYIQTELQKFHHKPPELPQDAPHSWNKPVYGKHIQLATHQMPAPNLNSADTNRLKSINGTFL